MTIPFQTASDIILLLTTQVTMAVQASGMTTTIPKTSGKRTKIGMRTRMKRGMSGMMAEQ